FFWLLIASPLSRRGAGLPSSSSLPCTHATVFVDPDGPPDARHDASFVLASATLKAWPSASTFLRGCINLRESANFPAACVLLCVRFVAAVSPGGLDAASALARPVCIFLRIS